MSPLCVRDVRPPRPLENVCARDAVRLSATRLSDRKHGDANATPRRAQGVRLRRRSRDAEEGKRRSRGGQTSTRWEAMRTKPDRKIGSEFERAMEGPMEGRWKGERVNGARETCDEIYFHRSCSSSPLSSVRYARTDEVTDDTDFLAQARKLGHLHCDPVG